MRRRQFLWPQLRLLLLEPLLLRVVQLLDVPQPLPHRLAQPAGQTEAAHVLSRLQEGQEDGRTLVTCTGSGFRVRV